VRNAAFIIILTAIMSGCVNAESSSDSVITAQPFVGLQERQDRTELRELTGVDPVRTEWCAAFVNAILEIEGIPGSDSVSDYPLTARSFLSWGEPVDPEDIRRGDIVVFPRGTQGWQGHVGFFVEEQNGYWVILGGNQDQSVNYQLFDPRRVIAVRRYIDPDSIKQERLAWLLKI
jgi:uncharacterized protein (TIGR02594 family)